MQIHYSMADIHSHTRHRLDAAYTLTLSSRIIGQSNISSAERGTNFKLALQAYKTLTLHQPSHLSSLLFPHSTGQLMRSAYQNLIHQPGARTVTGSRASSSSAPKYGILYHHLYAPRHPSTISCKYLKLIFFVFISIYRSRSFCTGIRSHL
jgi:hypothetical protein